MIRFLPLAAILLALAPAPAQPAAAFPPGWLPVAQLDTKTPWADFRKRDDRIHVYLPPGVKTVRGVFACFVFHSHDPRELADAWGFALVTVPWPFEYDLGHNDKRNGRYKLGHPVGSTDLLLRYLDEAGKATGHPELSTAPIVGWLMQNGPVFATDLLKRAPGRVVAWSDGFPNRVAQHPDTTAKVPFAYAWEFTANEEKERTAERALKLPTVRDQLTPAPNLACRANTYGFPHGVYSKFSFFAAFLDRCIRLRVPAEPGAPLRPVTPADGWVGDYNDVGEWNAIAPAPQAKGMVSPQWLPDEYAAWVWRSYHSKQPDVRLTAPVVEYRKTGDRSDCGMGYGRPLNASEPVSLAAEAKGDYAKVEFRDGDKLLGVAERAPWRLEGVRLERGLRVLIAVGVRADGTRAAARPGFVVVK